MALAGQTPGAVSTIWQSHTTLPLNVDRSLGLCALLLGFVLLLFLRIGRLLRIVIKFALLALFRTVPVHGSALYGRLARLSALVIFALFFPKSGIFGLLGLLFLLKFLLFLVETFADMCRRGCAEDWPSTVFALHGIYLVFQWAAAGEASDGLLVKRVNHG